MLRTLEEHYNNVPAFLDTLKTSLSNHSMAHGTRLPNFLANSLLWGTIKILLERLNKLQCIDSPSFIHYSVNSADELSIELYCSVIRFQAIKRKEEYIISICSPMLQNHYQEKSPGKEKV